MDEPFNLRFDHSHLEVVDDSWRACQGYKWSLCTFRPPAGCECVLTDASMLVVDAEGDAIKDGGVPLVVMIMEISGHVEGGAIRLPSHGWVEVRCKHRALPYKAYGVRVKLSGRSRKEH